MNVSTAEARAKFCELVKCAEAGEEIVVTRRGKPVARIVPPMLSKTDKPSLLGALKGKIWIAPDFDELGPEWDEYR